jgi:hypothetical protein
MYRYGMLHRAHKSLSLKRKSLTSAWGRSLFSTRKPPEHLGSVYNLPNEVAEVAEAAEVAPEVAEPAELAEAAEAAAVAAAFRGELAASFARLEHFPIALGREFASQPV